MWRCSLALVMVLATGCPAEEGGGLPELTGVGCLDGAAQVPTWLLAADHVVLAEFRGLGSDGVNASRKVVGTTEELGSEALCSGAPRPPGLSFTVEETLFTRSAAPGDFSLAIRRWVGRAEPNVITAPQTLPRWDNFALREPPAVGQRVILPVITDATFMAHVTTGPGWTVRTQERLERQHDTACDPIGVNAIETLEDLRVVLDGADANARLRADQLNEAFHADDGDPMRLGVDFGAMCNCTTDENCDVGEVCMGGWCHVDGECTTTADCPTSEICGPDGFCAFF